MPISAEEKRLLRELAWQVAEAAELPIQTERIRLWRDSNALVPKRAMILADPQNGWNELVPESTLKCQNPFARTIEMTLRRTIFRHQHIHDDYPITKIYPVEISIHKSSYGVENKYVRSDYKNGSYHIEPSIRTFDDMKKLRPAVIEVDWETTYKRMELADDILGDILMVQLRGVSFCRCGLTRILVHMRGLDQMMLDIYDKPEMLHELMAFLRDEQLREYEYYETKGLLSLNNGPNSFTGSGGIAHTDDLPSKDFTGRVRMKDMFAWGESQEFVGVGPKQFYEFVLEYQIPILKRFGLVDYGCCEPLDKKFDLIIDNIPNLRWVSVSPWCDRKVAAEKLGNRYVYVYKPNPSRICSPKPDFEAAEKDIRETLEIARGCSVHIVMKDTHTFFNQPERITRWTDMAVRMAEDMAQ
ncbi:MAG: hypothetical protein GX094_11150 [Clostridiales bacterium]|jgi:hypothetical protein|nr:hypothetical protein [Clostridiales bacterium]